MTDQQTDSGSDSPRRGGKAQDAYRTISEVADDLDLPQHVLRFWESKFAQVKPLKRGGNRRYYRPADIDLLRAIKLLLHTEGYTIRGVQKLFKEQGSRVTVEQALSGQTPLQRAQEDATAPSGPAARDAGAPPHAPDLSAETGRTAPDRPSADTDPSPEPAPILPAAAATELSGLLGDLKALRQWLGETD